MNIYSEDSTITPPLHASNAGEEPATFTPLLPKQREENSYSIHNISHSNPTISKTSRATLNKEQENHELHNLHKYHKCFHPFLDTSGSATSILKGLSYLTLLGIVVGVLMPKNNDLPTPSYRYLSSIIGYTYFIFWCSSFYPQIISNYERKTTEGLSVDFSIINFLGYICYSSYTSLLYWNRDIQQLYQERHSALIESGNGDGQATQNEAKITVQSNDVAFALHAVLFSAIWIYQLFLYGGLNWHEGKFPLSRIFVVFICLIVSSIALYVYLILKVDTSKPSRSEWELEHLNWLDFLYYLSFIKLAITLSKYVPQVVLNARRKTCAGWNVWNIILDFAGAVLSFVQLLGDAIDLDDFSSITGNAAKLGLSIISIGFDITFFLQHYVWYPDDHSNNVLQKELELII